MTYLRRSVILFLLTLPIGGCDTLDAPRLEPVRFAPVSVAPFADPGSLTDAWADVDGDGDPDRFVGFNGTSSRLYRNDGGLRFTDVASELSLDVARPVRTAAWGDYDADGDPDLLLGFAGDGPSVGLYRNQGDAGFVDVAESLGLSLEGVATRQASWVDTDGDGDLDLFLALRDAPNRLWRNDGTTFADVTEASGIGDPRRSVGAVWFDFDEDGDLDVYVANMNGDANGMWRNTGGAFEDVAEALGLDGGGRPLGDEGLGTVRPCAVDFDHDGHLDLSTANYGTDGLLRNPGPSGGRWEDVGGTVGLALDSRYDTCAWGDFDHDGRVDYFVNGTVTGGQQYADHLYRREGGSRFVDVTPPEILATAGDHGATWVDADRDGDLDLAFNGVGDDGSHPLLQNLLKPEFQDHSVQVRVVDERGAAVRPGAEVRVYVAGTNQLLGMGLVDTGSGYDAQNDLPVHVAVPGAQPIDVVVTFPDGTTRRTARVDGVDVRADGPWLEVVVRD